MTRRLLAGAAVSVVFGVIVACVGDEAPTVFSSPDSGAEASTPPPLPVTPGEPAGITFGERSSATHRGVTTDAHVSYYAPKRTLNTGGSPVLVTARAVEADVVALLRFDLTSLAPATRITKATLQLWTDGSSGCSAASGSEVLIHRVLEQWTEGDGPKDGAQGFVNFLERGPALQWTAPGVGAPGSRSADASAMFVPPAAALSTIDVTELTRAWVTDPANNFGVALLLATGDAGASNELCFVSSESSQEDRRPLLVLETD